MRRIRKVGFIYRYTPTASAASAAVHLTVETLECAGTFCSSVSDIPSSYYFNSESAVASTAGQSNMAEENSKLREALRRLHTQSTTDKSKLEMLTEKCDKDEQELITLREYQEHTEAEVQELREIVDSAASYEAMIESLTERNLELSQSAQQLESTVR